VKRAVFLDRDGVVNVAYTRKGKPYPPRDLNQLIILAGVKESVRSLTQFGFVVVVITNQPDISNGASSYDKVNLIHKEIASVTGIEYFYVCPHMDTDDCPCRKPKPGLLLQASRELNLDLSKSYVIGDRWRDIGAGQSAGCRNFFIDYCYSEKRPIEPFTPVLSLSHATELILGEVS